MAFLAVWGAAGGREEGSDEGTGAKRDIWGALSS